MTLAQLRYFCTAARYYSITQAANILFVTQPTVSIAIRDLEREFSLTLFTHANGSLTLTDEGEAFYNRASEILSQCDDLVTEYDGSKPVRNRFSIGIPPMLSTIFSRSCWTPSMRSTRTSGWSFRSMAPCAPASWCRATCWTWAWSTWRSTTSTNFTPST